MKTSNDWNDFKARLDKYYPRIGKPTQVSLEFADDAAADTGKGPQMKGRQLRACESIDFRNFGMSQIKGLGPPKSQKSNRFTGSEAAY